MSLLKDILHAATGIGQHAAESAKHVLDGGAPAAPGAVGKAMDAVENAQPMTKIPYKNGFYAGDFDPNHAEGNPTKIPYNNGFYAGAYDPSHTLRGHLNDAMPQFAQPNFGGQNQNLQGAENPGLIPMQGSVGVPHGDIQGGGDIYWQNTDGVRRGMVNPQVDDNGFYYN
jgi:hypothetical protein